MNNWLGYFGWTKIIPTALYYPVILLLTYFLTWVHYRTKHKKVEMDLSTAIELVAYGSALFWATHGFKKCFFEMSSSEEHDLLIQLAGSLAFLVGGVTGVINSIKKLINSSPVEENPVNGVPADIEPASTSRK